MRAAGDYRCGRAWLDRQYDARGSVADAELYLERRRTWSRHVRRRLQFGGDLHYGPGPRERLDLFTPATPSPWPIVIYVHGGYWRANDKQDSSFVAASLVPLGIAVAVVDYPLMPGPTMDSVVGSVRTAAAWLHACAAGLGLDASRLFVVGHSSGGHLGAMIAADGWQTEYGVPADIVKGACLISGLYDLEPLRHTRVNEWVRLTARSARRNSPQFHLPRPNGRVVVVVGGRETDEFRRQSRAYADACVHAGMNADLMELRGRNHFETPEGLHRSQSLVARVVAATVARAGARVIKASG